MKLTATGMFLMAAAMTLIGSTAMSEEKKEPAGSGLSIYDSKGTLIGSYSRDPALSGPNWEFALVASFSTPFYAAVTTLGFQTNGAIYYTSADCSGTAYVDLNFPMGYEFPTSTGQPSPPFVSTAAIIGHTAYISGGPVVSIVYLGFTDTAGVCQQTTGGNIFAQGVVTTVNLSSFVRPFSVH
jgi:hypothetical protein